MRPRAADSRPCERAVRRLAPIRQLLREKENLPRPRQMGISACCAATCTAFPAPGPSRRTAGRRMVSAPTPHFCHVGAHSMRPNLCLMALVPRFLPNLRGKRRRAGRFPAGSCRRYHSRLPAGRSALCAPCAFGFGGGWISCEAGCAPSRSPALSCLWFLPTSGAKDAGPAGFRPARCIP